MHPGLDPRDAVLQSTCPVVIAPRFGALPPMPPGQRLIAAANGLFVQVKLDWLDCVHCLTPQGLGLPLPYGSLKEHLRFAFGVLPIRLIEQFVDAGRHALPNESAGALIYSRSNRRLRLAICEPAHCSPTRIDYRLPLMAADETLAVDLHTHGRLPAFWSDEDDRDDQGSRSPGYSGGSTRNGRMRASDRAQRPVSAAGPPLGDIEGRSAADAGAGLRSSLAASLARTLVSGR